MSFQIIRNDITKVKADVIVNTANPKPVYGSGVDQAIYKAAGEKELLAERKKIGNIHPGEIAVTPAFKLDAKYIIHTVGPIWEDGRHGEFDILKSCYEKSLKKATDLGCQYIAFPLIATGVYGFPKDKAFQIAMNVLQDYAMHHKINIYLVIFDAQSYELIGRIFDDIKSYVDDNYVENAQKEYYELEARYSRERDARIYRRKRIEEELAADRKYHYSYRINETVSFAENEIAPPPAVHEVANDDKTFQEKLFEYIDRTGEKDSKIYRPILMSRQTFGKIRNNVYYQPTRENAIRLCISLQLNIDETNDLLARAGFVLNPTKKFDMVIKGFIIKQQYSIKLIEDYLMDNGLPTLLDYGKVVDDKADESRAKAKTTKKQ